MEHTASQSRPHKIQCFKENAVFFLSVVLKRAIFFVYFNYNNVSQVKTNWFILLCEKKVFWILWHSRPSE